MTVTVGLLAWAVVSTAWAGGATAAARTNAAIAKRARVSAEKWKAVAGAYEVQAFAAKGRQP